MAINFKDKIKNILKRDNLIKKNINDSIGVDEGIKYKIENWRENIPDIDKITTVDNVEIIKEDYEKSKQDYFDFCEIEKNIKTNLDNELMDIFGVSNIKDIKYNWIKVVMEGGNLQNDTEWETEEEFEILINASERFTPERYQTLMRLCREEITAQNDVSKSSKVMHKKQEQCQNIQNMQRISGVYQKQLDRANMLSARIHRQLGKHEKLIAKIRDINERQMEELYAMYEQAESAMQQFENDIINGESAVKTTTMLAETILNEIKLQSGDISEQALLTQLEITAIKLKGNQIDNSQLSENNLSLLSMCENLIAEEQSLLDGENSQCKDKEKELENISSFDTNNNRELELIAGMEKELTSIGIRIGQICDSSLSNSLGEYESICTKLEYYLEQVYNNFDATNPTNYNEKEVNEMLDNLARLYTRLEECDRFIEDEFDKILDDIKSVSFDMSVTIEQTQKKNAEYVFETNNWLVVGLDSMQKAMEEEQVTLPENIQEIYDNYLKTQLKECKENCVDVSARTEMEIPIEFKSNYNNLKQNISTLNQGVDLHN